MLLLFPEAGTGRKQRASSTPKSCCSPCTEPPVDRSYTVFVFFTILCLIGHVFANLYKEPSNIVDILWTERKKLHLNL